MTEQAFFMVLFALAGLVWTFHGLLSDDMGTLVDERYQLLYSFFNADQIGDFVPSIGMKPFVELSFMPTTLASGATNVFRYQANVTPPKDYQQQPVETIEAYRTAVRMSRVPWPIRQWLWWGALNIFGPTRCRHFGTFLISSVGAHGSGILHLAKLLTSMLHIGMIDPTGELHMRVTFDHRVLDGAAVAGALDEMEAV